MKIIIASFTYPPNVDGVAEAAHNMAESFRHAGHQVFIASFPVSHTTTESAEDENYVHRFHITGSPDLFSGFKGETKAYKDFIISLNPDVIVFHGWDTWPVEVALPLLPLLRAKSILLSHGQSSHLLNLSLLPRGLWKWFRWLPHVCSLPWKIRRFDKVVFLSHKANWGRFFDARIARFTRARNIAIIPNGVPELQGTLIEAFRQRHGVGTGLMFLCIANYSVRKNQERALRAFAAAALPEATLVFIGSQLGDYGKRMVGLWHALQTAGAGGRVLFLEGLERNETLAALQDCDVMVLAADAETQPIVLLEAMAASKPFISTNTGCVEEFKGGIIVRDAAEMAKAMCRLAVSPIERKLLGKEGRQDYKAHYSLERTSKSWLQLLEDIVVR